MTRNPTDGFAEMRGRSPEEAKFFWNGGPIEVADRTWFSSMLSGVTAFDTDDGVVLVDAGTELLAPGIAAEIRTETSAPIHTAIFTHGHVDHAYGLPHFLLEGQNAPTVIGHRDMPARFERYAKTTRHNSALNARQFGGSVDNDTGVAFDLPAILPDTVYESEMTVEVGGVTFELRHARGETDDHTWVFCPERSVLCPGDLVIWGIPNAGNPQKVQRHPWDWAEALRQMAAVEPRSLAPGHGGPVVGDPDLVQRILLETADFLQVIVDRTLEIMEDGSPPHVDVVRRLELPVSDSPWLQPVYDEAEFIARNVIRYYGGWFSGRPSDLKPAPRTAVAAAIAEATGGAVALVHLAESKAADGDLAVACHLADYALEADPADETVQQVVAAIYEQRSAAEDSLMAINLFRSAYHYARDGRPYC